MESSLYGDVFERIVSEIDKGARLHRYGPRRRLVHPVLIERVRKLVANTGATVRFGKPCYCRDTDRVFVPKIERSRDEARAVQVLFHEAIHWTSARARLNRNFEGLQLNIAQHYVLEELVAEFGASFLCADFGITPGILPYAADYIARFATAVRADAYTSKAAEVPDALAFAARQAEAAVAYLYRLSRQ